MDTFFSPYYDEKGSTKSAAVITHLRKSTLCTWSLSKYIKNSWKSQDHVLKTIFRPLSSLELTLGGTLKTPLHMTELVFPYVRP